MAIEIKSSLLNEDELKFVKNSIIAVSEKDNKQDFRVRTVEYINDSSAAEEDEFFFDMIEFLRFLDPDTAGNHIAYTTPDCMIYLNCPNKEIGENVRNWEFVFDHECMHQLWETFKVEDQIRKESGSCDHELLNIASDCVINDYLAYWRKKAMPNVGITPEKIKEKFGVEFDRKSDTQYSLYLKLKTVADKNKELMKQLMNDPDFRKAMEEAQQGQGQQSQGQGQAQGHGQGQGQDSGSGNGDSDGNSDIDNMSAKEAAETAQKAADEAKEAAGDTQKAADDLKDKASKSGSSKDKEAAGDAQKAADEAKEAAEDAQKAADEAKEAAKNKDTNTARNKAKEAIDKADEAKNKANKNSSNGNGKEGEGESEGEGEGSGKGSGKGAGKGKGNYGSAGETPEDLEKIRKKFHKVLDKYANTISGMIGDFTKKSKSSLTLNKNGLRVGTQNHVQSGWDKDLAISVNNFVKKKVFQKKKEWERTYKRIKRGSGFIEYGQPIQAGKKTKKQAFIINVAFYIDRSGSMGGRMDNVFEAAYTIAESLKKRYNKEKVVDDVIFKMYTFDDVFDEIKWGNKVHDRGGTMPFHKLLSGIIDRTNDYLVNIIITDAQFPQVQESEVTKFLSEINGMVNFITNTENTTIKKIAEKNSTKLYYLLADSNFILDKNL